MSPTEKMNHLILSECDRFGEVDAQKAHYNHDYYAHKDGMTLFLESGSRFPGMPLPEKNNHQVKVVSFYPSWYVEQENRRLEKTETDEVPF